MMHTKCMIDTCMCNWIDFCARHPIVRRMHGGLAHKELMLFQLIAEKQNKSFMPKKAESHALRWHTNESCSRLNHLLVHWILQFTVHITTCYILHQLPGWCIHHWINYTEWKIKILPVSSDRINRVMLMCHSHVFGSSVWLITSTLICSS